MMMMRNDAHDGSIVDDGWIDHADENGTVTESESGRYPVGGGLMCNAPGPETL
jgi:hypothetical protein